MNRIVFDCEIITPMFLYGACGKTPELRAPSIKGAMRFWWRAVRAENDLTKMKNLEDSIFGGSGEKEGRSKFSITVKCDSISTKRHKILPHHTGNRTCPYLPGCESRYNPGTCRRGRKLLAFDQQNLQVILQYGKFPEGFSTEKLIALFKLTSCLGGLGRRSRRGFGSFLIISERSKCDNLEYLLELLNIVAGESYVIRDKSIILSKNCNANYPFIRKIDVGKIYPTTDELLKTIGRASHEAAVKYRSDKSLGYAEGCKRLASPIYVSVLKSNRGYRPIITTLQMALKTGVGDIDTGKQMFFKEAIL